MQVTQIAKRWGNKVQFVKLPASNIDAHRRQPLESGQF
jgi:hypothetical protein